MINNPKHIKGKFIGTYESKGSNSMGFYNFSEIGIDNNSYYLDVYNFDYKYLFSYRIPFANKIKPYSIAINFDKNEISVLYNDYFTLKKFSY